MKKFIALTLSLLLVFLLCSCDSDTTNETTTAATNTEQVENEEETTVKDYPIVTITMENGGVITAELYPDIAPNTVYNFISLANSGFYDGTIFHRVIEGFMIQGGDPDGTGMGGPDYTIKGEFAANGVKNSLKHIRGVLSMARSSAYDSAGSQFFIMVDTASYLDGQYAAFGAVIDGMDVVDAIVSQDTDSSDRPLSDQVMKSVRVDTKGVEYPEPETIK